MVPCEAACTTVIIRVLCCPRSASALVGADGESTCELMGKEQEGVATVA